MEHYLLESINTKRNSKVKWREFVTSIIPGSLSKTKESNNTFCHVIISFSIQFVIEKPELQSWLWCFISPFITSNPVKRRNKIRSCGALKSNHLNSPSSKCWLCLLVNCESCPPTEGWSYSLLPCLLLNLRGKNFLLGFHHVDTLVWDLDTCTDLKLVLVAQWESADSTFGRVIQVQIHGTRNQLCQIWIIWLSLMSERMPVHFSNSLLLW